MSNYDERDDYGSDKPDGQEERVFCSKCENEMYIADMWVHDTIKPGDTYIKVYELTKWQCPNCGHHTIDSIRIR